MAIWFRSVYTISFGRQPAFEDFCGLVDEAGAVGEFVEEEAGEAAGVEAMARRSGLEFGGQVVDFHAWRMPGRGGKDNGAGAIWVQGRRGSYSQGGCVWVLSRNDRATRKADEMRRGGVACG